LSKDLLEILKDFELEKTENLANKLSRELFQKIFEYAKNLRKKNFKNKLYSCAILSIKTGNCKADCKFCSQSRLSKAKINIHPLLDWEDIEKALSWAQKNNIKRFSFVSSGISPTKEELKKISSFIEKAKTCFPSLKICASLGILKKDELKLLKDSGLDRYHNNLETSKEYYKYISSLPWEEKFKTICFAKEVGLEVCSGGIFGIGETLKDVISLAETIKEIADGVPINFLVPIKGTPFENKKPLNFLSGILILSILRLLLPDKNLLIAGGRQIVFKNENYLLASLVSGIMFGNYLTTQGKSLEEDKFLFYLFDII